LLANLGDEGGSRSSHLDVDLRNALFPTYDEEGSRSSRLEVDSWNALFLTSGEQSAESDPSRKTSPVDFGKCRGRFDQLIGLH
jgi:hypothetical protein